MPRPEAETTKELASRGNTPRAVAIALLALFAAACDLPRDPRGTLAAVRGEGRLVVGLSEAPPWVVLDGGEPAGIEVDLVRGFAASLGAEVEWVPGALPGHLAALERFELDLVAGGLEAGSPWSKRVAFTRPYLEADEVVGVPPGTAAPGALDGLRVAVAPGDRLAATLADRGALVVRHRQPWASGLPVAAPLWEVAARGYTPAGEPLARARHVLAVPPGENGLLSELELFLGGQRGRVGARLGREAAR